MDKILNNLRNHAGKWVSCLAISLGLIWGATTYVQAVAKSEAESAVEVLSTTVNHIERDVIEIKDGQNGLVEKTEKIGEDLSYIRGKLDAESEG